MATKLPILKQAQIKKKFNMKTISKKKKKNQNFNLEEYGYYSYHFGTTKEYKILRFYRRNILEIKG